jgi:hypothetical protein
VELQAGRLEAARRAAVAGALGSQATRETTSWIVGLVTIAHLELQLGELGPAATLLGATSWLVERSGFDPALMDADIAAWTCTLRWMLADSGLEDAFVRGRRLSADPLRSLLQELVAERPRPSRIDGGVRRVREPDRISRA